MVQAVRTAIEEWDDKIFELELNEMSGSKNQTDIGNTF